jgi:hypothetical protein
MIPTMILSDAQQETWNKLTYVKPESGWAACNNGFRPGEVVVIMATVNPNSNSRAMCKILRQLNDDTK